MKRIFFILLVLFAVQSVRAQEHATRQVPRHGVSLDGSWLKELYPDRYYYRVCDVKVSYRYDFGDVGWCNFTALGSLNFGRTRYSAVAFPTDDYRNGIEVGFTAGMLWNIYIYEDYLRFYLGGFIGPQYTPDMPARQGGWLNFSDNLCGGFGVRFSRHLYGDLRFVFRHMSNAGFFTPNHGINSLGFGFGVVYKF